MNLKPSTLTEGAALSMIESVMEAGEYQLRSRQEYAEARKEVDVFYVQHDGR